MPALPTVTANNLVASLIWFPVVGAVLGAGLGAVELLLRVVVGLPEISCGAVVILGLLLTQARPAIGLMVLAGAFFGGHGREAIAELATRSRPTSFGLLAGLTCLLYRYALLLAVPPQERFGALIMAWGLSRAAVVWVCWRFPYAGTDTGIGGWLVALAGPRDLLLVLPVVALGFGLLPWFSALTVLVGAWALGHGFAVWVTRTLEGLTSQACEATAELSELSALSAAALMANLPIG